MTARRRHLRLITFKPAIEGQDQHHKATPCPPTLGRVAMRSVPPGGLPGLSTVMETRTTARVVITRAGKPVSSAEAVAAVLGGADPEIFKVAILNHGIQTETGPGGSH